MLQFWFIAVYGNVDAENYFAHGFSGFNVLKLGVCLHLSSKAA
jgi:hypothetical protein